MCGIDNKSDKHKSQFDKRTFIQCVEMQYNHLQLNANDNHTYRTILATFLQVYTQLFGIIENCLAHSATSKAKDEKL